MTHRSLAAALFCVVLAGPAPALASPDYPDVIKQDLGLPVDPPCTLCHAPGTPGLGTVVTFFGRTILSLGVTQENDDSLRSALAEMDADQTDSDGDGTPDIEELRNGTDPNDGPGNNLPVPQTGCSVANRGDRSVASVALAALLAIALIGRRNRKSHFMNTSHTNTRIDTHQR